jgi:hypothetical protein
VEHHEYQLQNQGWVRKRSKRKTGLTIDFEKSSLKIPIEKRFMTWFGNTISLASTDAIAWQVCNHFCTQCVVSVERS